MIKKILYFLLTLFLLAGILFFALKNGISIAHIQFDFFKLEQLYIKLDKKLIVRAKKISFKEDKNLTKDFQDNIQANSKELLKITRNLKYFYAFVEEIDIQDLSFKDQRVRILFKDDEFFVDNNLLSLNLSLHRENHEIQGDIKKLFLKDYGLNIDGNLSINTQSEFYIFEGNAYSDLFDFNSTLAFKNGLLSYDFKDINIKDTSRFFKELEEKAKLPKILNLWLGHRIKADYCHLDYIKGYADLKAKNYYFDDISALGYANNVEVRLNDNAMPIKISRLDMNLSKQKLDFNFNQASYNGANLSQSKLYVFEIFNPKAGMFIHIKSDELKLDSKLVEMLKTYHINIPFYQTSGNLKSDLILDFGFNKNLPFKYSGNFYLQQVDLSLANFNVSKALIKLKNSKLDIEDASVKNDLLNADFNASIDLANKEGNFTAKIQNLTLPNDILNMTDKDLKLSLDFNDGVRLQNDDFGLNMLFKEGMRVELENLAAFVPYSSLMQKLGIEKSDSFTYETKDFNDFQAQIQALKFASPFLDKTGKNYNQDDINITKSQNIMNINTKSDLVNVFLKDDVKEIYLKDLTFLYESKKEGYDLNLSKNTDNIKLQASNFKLILQDQNKTLDFDKLEASVMGDEIKLQANKNQVLYNLSYGPKAFKLSVKNINDRALNDFLQKQIVENGNFNLYVVGANLDYFEGKIDFSNTFIKDLKGYNQLISFIDTVPSLLLFKSPTFNEKGLKLEDGIVIFTKKKDLLNFNSISLNGDSVDIFGLGTANLRLDTLNLDLELKTLKSTSEAISKVPILNYVVLGKNQEISTNIKVDGSFNEPKFRSQILKDTLKTPFNLIKNIITLPGHLLN